MLANKYSFIGRKGEEGVQISYSVSVSQLHMDIFFFWIRPAIPISIIAKCKYVIYTLKSAPYSLSLSLTLLLPFSCETQFKLVCLPVVPISKYKPIIKAISITYTHRIASHRTEMFIFVFLLMSVYVCVCACVCSICNCELCLMSIFDVIISMPPGSPAPRPPHRACVAACLTC